MTEATEATDAPLEELVAYVASALVDNPDVVEVKMTPGDNEDLYELQVEEEDLGNVIGRQGRTARAMRSLLRAAAAKEDRRVRLDILE